MMDRMNIKKYTITLLVCFFSFICITEADSISYGSQKVILGSDYINGTCEFEGEKSGGITLFQNEEGAWIVSYDNAVAENSTDKIICKFDGRNAVGKTDKDGKLEYTYHTQNTVTKTVPIDPSKGTTDIKTILGNATIVSVDGGNEYVTVDSNGNITLTQEAQELISGANGSNVKVGSDITIKYKVPGSDEIFTATITAQVDLFNGARIYPSSELGSCSIDSSTWKAKTWTDSAGTTTYNLYQAKGSATLPSCNARNEDLPLTFEGWYEVSNGVHITTKEPGECSSLGAKAAGSAAESGKSYAACYEMKKTVQITVMGGSFASESWKSIDGGMSYYYAGDGSSATLPKLKWTGYKADMELDFWESDKGERAEDGATVALDGSVWRAVVKKSTVTRDYEKRIYVNDKPVVFSVSGKKSIGCSSDNSDIVSVEFNGECQVYGLAPTEGSTVTVTMDVEDGDPIEFNVTVLAKTGETQNEDDIFVIDTSTNMDYTSPTSYDEDAEGVMGKRCKVGDSVFISSHYKDQSYKFHLSDAAGNSWIYTATGCGENYYSFCVDPGLPGPGEAKATHNYYVTDDLNADVAEPIRKMISYMANNYDVKNEFRVQNNPHRVGSHVAIRLKWIEIGLDNADGGLGGTHLDRYLKWKTASDAAASGDYAGAYAALGITHLTSVTDVTTAVLENYASEDDLDLLSGDIKREIDDKNTELTGDNSYEITYTGTMTVPVVDSTDVTLEPCGANSFGITCEVVSWTETGDVSDNDAKIFEYEVKVIGSDANSVKVPKTDEEKATVSFVLKYSASNSKIGEIFVARPINGIKSQAMILFDLDNNNGESYVYFSIIPDRTACDLDGLDYTKCTGEGACDINVELFKATGCCAEITDENTYQYAFDTLCTGRCTTSSFESVCKYYDGADSTDAEIYLIKEGTNYTGGGTSGFINNIGSCIVNVEDNFSTAGKTPFQKTDDNQNSINIDSYAANQYCQITCKEDWAISMDSFGNYVGENAVAAGTYFAIMNDIFIGGERTCYTSFLDYNKYMNDLTKDSEDMAKQYNRYSINSHSWTDIDQQTSSDITSSESGKSCVLYGECSDLGGDHDWSFDSGDKDCYYEYEEEECTGEGEDEECEMVTKEHHEDLPCDVEGKTFDYEIKTKNNVESGKYVDYTTKQSTPADSFGTQINTVNSIVGSGDKKNYNRTDKITCSITENVCEECEATLECKYETTTRANDSLQPAISGTLDKSFCSSYAATDSGAFCADDSDSDDDSAFDDLQEVVLDTIEVPMSDARGQITTLNHDIYAKSQDFYDCQHFALYNTTDKEKNRAETEVPENEVILGESRQYVRINTQFDPDVSYKYDEDSFMTILGENNILVENTKKNTEVLGEDYDQATNKEAEAQIKGYDKYDTGNEVKLQRNKVETKYYNPSTHWTCNPDSAGKCQNAMAKNYGVDDSGNDTGKTKEDTGYTIKEIVMCTVGDDHQTYASNGNQEDAGSIFPGFTTSENEWIGGSCYKVKVKYVNAHYISTYIGNSSFYKNKGSWYVRGSDVKEHGENLKDALSRANSRGNSYRTDDQTELDRWSIMGLGYNVFPVSLSTPRNLYQYTYSFKDIGSFNNGKLGRIMGSAEKSIIPNNDRTCFYEIYEDVCLCCGSTINVHIDDDEASVTDKFLEDTGEFTYTPSNPDDIKINKDGTLTIASSSVSLNNIASKYNYNAEDEKVPTNWSDQAPYIYNGVRYYTEKGDQALKAIETKGETIYSEKPEYSYYLNPTSLGAIRDYNDSTGYEVNFNNLRVYGRYAMKSQDNGSSDSSFEVADQEQLNNEIPNIQHYGSIFLEEFMYDLNAVYESTLASTSNTQVCTITGEFSSDEMLQKVNSGCRWVDYVQESKPATSDKRAESGTYFRLAFK